MIAGWLAYCRAPVQISDEIEQAPSTVETAQTAAAHRQSQAERILYTTRNGTHAQCCNTTPACNESMHQPVVLEVVVQQGRHNRRVLQPRCRLCGARVVFRYHI